MAPQDPTSTPAPAPAAGPERRSLAAETAARPGRRLTVIFDADTAEVVALEADGDAAPRDAAEPPADLAAPDGPDTLESLIRDAFEAGIACVLGSGSARGEEPQSDQERELRALLLGALIEHSDARRLICREVLNRAMLATILAHADRGESELH